MHAYIYIYMHLYMDIYILHAYMCPPHIPLKLLCSLKEQ